MNTPADLTRQNFPEFLKELEKFKETFGPIKREYVKAGDNEFGKKFEGKEVNPELSEKEILNRAQLSKKYRDKK